MVFSLKNMRDNIRASLTRDLAASSQKIDNLLKDNIQAQDQAYQADQAQSDYPFPVSPGGLGKFSQGVGDEPNTPDADDRNFFVGVWRGQFEIMGLFCSSEMIFQPNGDYSSLSQSDNGCYAFRSVGKWNLLGQGNVIIHYTDHDPKEWNKKKLDFPENENIHFRVIDKNRMQSNLSEWQRV